MTDELQNLIEATDKWREHRSAKTVDPRSANPYGAKLYSLDQQWAKTKQEHRELLNEKRVNYLGQRARTLELIEQWKAENPQRPRASGRPATPHSDEVKIAAARALEAGVSKTMIRSVLGISVTAKLDAVLADGQEILKAGAQATDGEDW